MAPAEPIWALFSAEEARCQSAPAANFWASIEGLERRETSGRMAPASAIVVLFDPRAASCQSAPLAYVCVCVGDDEQVESAP